MECKLKHQNDFDGKKVKNDKVWLLAHTDYMKLIKDGDLQASDTLELEPFMRKYDKLLKHFRWYAHEVQRYKQSGASADDVDNIKKDACTDIFLKANYGSRPMSVAPFTIDGGSAATGGEESVFARGGNPFKDDDEPWEANALAAIGATIEPTVLGVLGDPFSHFAAAPTMAPGMAPVNAMTFTPAMAFTPTAHVPAVTTLDVPTDTAITAEVYRRPRVVRGRDTTGAMQAPPEPGMQALLALIARQDARADEQSKRQDKLMEALIHAINK